MIDVRLKQVHVTIIPMQNPYLGLRQHVGQSNDVQQNYIRATSRSISDRYACTCRLKYDDANMLPLLGSAKSSAVHMISGHNNYSLSSGTTYS
jgi:hypothetical protein